MTKTGVTIRRTHRERAQTFERIRRGPKGKNRGYRNTCWSFVREFADLYYPYHFSSAYCPYRLPNIILYSLGPSRLDTSQFTNSHNCRFIFATSRDTQQQTNNHLREKLPRLFWTYPTDLLVSRDWFWTCRKLFLWSFLVRLLPFRLPHIVTVWALQG